MKKRILILISAVFAVVSAAFGLAACKTNKPQNPVMGDEYVVWSDGAGRNYTLRGGEEIVVYYECEKDKVLNFTQAFYSVDTGKLLREYERFTVDCGEPSTWSRSDTAHPRTNGEYTKCTLTVVVSSGNAYTIEEEKEERVCVEENVGATLLFTPQYTGYYTVECKPRNADTEAQYFVTYGDKVQPSDGVYQCGWLYKIHVGWKNADNDIVTVNVHRTPHEIGIGENHVVLDQIKDQAFSFTPESDGYYTVKSFDEEDGEQYPFVVTYPSDGYVSAQGSETDVYLHAGKKYIIEYTIGFGRAFNAVLSVTGHERDMEEGEEIQTNRNLIHKFTAVRSGYYDFKFKNAGKDSVVIIDSSDTGKYEMSFKFDNALNDNRYLAAGEYYVSTDRNCEMQYDFAPGACYGGTPFYVYDGETRSFTPTFTAEYDFISETDGTVIKVTDGDGTVITGALTAGEEYFVTFSKKGNARIGVDTAAQLAHNNRFTLMGSAVTAFTPTVSGNYKFDGAGEIEIYDHTFDGLEREYGAFNLIKDRLYYVVLTAESGVTPKFNPPAIPTDGTTKVFDSSWLRVDVPLDESFEIAFSYNVTATLYDVDFNEIKSEEDTKKFVTGELEAGTYYLKINGYCDVGFAVRPDYYEETVTLEEGVSYKPSQATEYRVACGLLCKKIVVETRMDWQSYGALKVRLYRMDGGSKRWYAVKATLDEYDRVVYTFSGLEENVGEYLLSVESGVPFKVRFVR